MIDFTDEKKLREAVKPNTKLVWLETPTNPTLKVFDIALIGKLCKELNLIFVVDNTFFTPYL